VQQSRSCQQMLLRHHPLSRPKARGDCSSAHLGNRGAVKLVAGGPNFVRLSNPPDALTTAQDDFYCDVNVHPAMSLFHPRCEQCHPISISNPCSPGPTGNRTRKWTSIRGFPRTAPTADRPGLEPWPPILCAIFSLWTLSLDRRFAYSATRIDISSDGRKSLRLLLVLWATESFNRSHMLYQIFTTFGREHALNDGIRPYKSPSPFDLSIQGGPLPALLILRPLSPSTVLKLIQV
jgi:hypothetical protein